MLAESIQQYNIALNFFFGLTQRHEDGQTLRGAEQPTSRLGEGGQEHYSGLYGPDPAVLHDEGRGRPGVIVAFPSKQNCFLCISFYFHFS